MTKLLFSLLSISIFSVSCAGLKTRSDVEREQKQEKVEKNLVQLQQSKAEVVAQNQNLMEEIRRLSGEVQDLRERQGAEIQGFVEWRAQQEKKEVDLQARLKVYEQSISALEQEVLSLKSEQAPKASSKGNFEQAEEYMRSKDWKKAILEFEKYRSKYPSGRRVSMATYNIGVCFQELGLKEEAKAFFQETLNKYSKTTAASKAKYRLNQLK